VEWAPDVTVIALRAASFVAIFAASGAALFLALFARALDTALEPIRTRARAAALAALLLGVAYYVLIPARLAGSFGATFDPTLDALVSESSVGPAHAVRFVGLALLLVSLDEQTAPKRAASLAGAALALGSFALTGHTTIHEWRVALVPLLLAHLAAAAFWFGALWPLALVARCESTRDAAEIITRFSSIALRTVPLILVCGVAMAALFVRSVAELLTGYGALLITKAALFGVLMALAALNRTRYAPALESGRETARVTFTRVVRAEWLLIACVLIVTALLTELFAPENLHGTFVDGHAEDVQQTD
jgi:putative copper export protein